MWLGHLQNSLQRPALFVRLSPHFGQIVDVCY